MSKKVTELPAASVVNAGDLVPIVDPTGPSTKHATVSQIRGAIGSGSTITNAGSGALNNISSTDGDGALAGIIRFTTSTDVTITGIAGGVRGRRLTLVSKGAPPAPVTIKNQDSGSDSNNRIVTSTGADVTVPAGGAIELVYDGTTSVNNRWHVVGGPGGGGGGATPGGSDGDLQVKSGGAFVGVGGAAGAYFRRKADGTGVEAAPIVEVPTFLVAGDLLFFDGAALARIPIGLPGQVLIVNGAGTGYTFGAGGGGGASDPSTIYGANLKRWYGNTYANGVWTDESGNANTSQATAGKRPTTVTMPGGGLALVADGTDDVLNLGGDVEIVPDAFTLGFCFRSSAPPSAEKTVLGKYYSGKAFAIQQLTSGKLGCFVNSTSFQAVTDANVSNGAWHTFIAVWSGSLITLYVDGVEQASTATTSSPMTDTTEILALFAAASTESTAVDNAACSVGALVIADRASSTPEVASLHSFLRSKMAA